MKEHINKAVHSEVKPFHKVAFTGKAEIYLREIKLHQDKYMQLERQANKLESAIRSNKESKNKMNEVYKLRNEAQEGKDIQQRIEKAKRGR